MLDDFDLNPELTHLNHGSFGAVPRVVTEAQNRIRARAEANPLRFFRVEAPDLKERSRHVAADFLGCGADEVALVRNVTQAADVVLAGLAAQHRLGRGDVVVVGEQAYEPVRRTVAHWCRRTGATYAVVPHPVDVDEHALLEAFDIAFADLTDDGHRIALVMLDHITSTTGALLPVSALCGLAREIGALSFVDAAHVPGQVQTSPSQLGADFWTGTWHKWGFAGRGTAVLWLSAEEREGMVPLVTSGDHAKPSPLPFDTEGTDDYSGWFSLHAAVDFWERAGGWEIAERCTALVDHGATVVADALPMVEAVPPKTPAPCLRLVPLPDGAADTREDADDLYGRLSDAGIETQVTPYGGRGWIRLSAAIYNRPEDYQRLAGVLPRLL